MKPTIPRPFGEYVPVTFAKNQPPYHELPALQGEHPEHEVISEWELTEEELDVLVRSGGRIRLRVWTFGHPLQPVKLEVIE